MNQKPETEDEGGFTSEGYAPMPPLYHDQERIHDVVAWPAAMLTSRIVEYTEFMQQDPAPMPRAQAIASRLLQHMLKEEEWRITEDDQ